MRPGFINPMLSQPGEIPEEGHVYELKYDGIRAQVVVINKTIEIFSRKRRLISKQFPELLGEQTHLDDGVYDGEIFVLKDGKPDFMLALSRLNHAKPGWGYPAQCVLFDRMHNGKERIVRTPWSYRREPLEAGFSGHPRYRLSELFGDGHSLFSGVTSLGLEGIMAKRTDSPYLPGRRSDSWLKIKVRKQMNAYIVGHTNGKGDRERLGALHLADNNGEYIGKVGSGLSDTTIERVLDLIEDQPNIPCRISYTYKTEAGLREPVFMHLRED